MSGDKNQRLDRLKARESDLRSEISNLDLLLSHLPADSRMAVEYKFDRDIAMSRLGHTINEIEDMELPGQDEPGEASGIRGPSWMFTDRHGRPAEPEGPDEPDEPEEPQR